MDHKPFIGWRWQIHSVWLRIMCILTFFFLEMTILLSVQFSCHRRIKKKKKRIWLPGEMQTQPVDKEEATSKISTETDFQPERGGRWFHSRLGKE